MNVYLEEGCFCQVKFPVRGLEGTAGISSLNVVLDPLGHNFFDEFGDES